MKIVFTLKLLLIASGSVNAQEIYKGHYVKSREHSGFTRCGVDETWWLEGIRSSVYLELEEFIKKNSLRSGKSYMKPNIPFFIEVTGTRSAKGKWGHMGRYQYELKVKEIIDISVTDKCTK